MVALHPPRRNFIAAIAGVLLSGCTVVGDDNSSNDSPHSDTDQIREVVVTSYREETVQLAVLIEMDNRENFSNVYTLSPDEYDEGESISGLPSKVTAFTADGMSMTWTDITTSKFNCDAPDIEIAVRPEEFSLNYPC